MRDRMEKLALLPFSIGCVSESSVAIGVHQYPRRTKQPHLTNPSLINDEESLPSSESMKNELKLSDRFHRLVKGFKTLSHIFVYEEEEGVEMEIGGPTDVKHVTHIGWDGSENDNPLQGWDNLISPELLSSETTASLRQFELSMASQHDSSSPTLVN